MQRDIGQELINKNKNKILNRNRNIITKKQYSLFDIVLMVIFYISTMIILNQCNVFKTGGSNEIESDNKIYHVINIINK